MRGIYGIIEEPKVDVGVASERVYTWSEQDSVATVAYSTPGFIHVKNIEIVS